MIKLFLSPAGRMGRRNFWIGVVGFVLFVALMQFILRTLGPTLAQFFLSLIYIVLVFLILYSVYGKRLHDIGRSFWPLTGMITLTILIVMGIMLAFGGAEYFTEFAQYDRKEDIDPTEIERIKSAYQARLSNAGKVMEPLIYFIWAAFTLWLGLAKPQNRANKYGPIISG
ncbi:DUF805 domain-containing protein [Litorimonas sp.]|jgi:uncharacterized membrane protein YhaH (DUF805 family)|uniref:DUF805 domain-containing protein n=1 Tax=Litorimonas sp. TaxID=1892381 RepID=UPI003A84F7EA